VSGWLDPPSHFSLGEAQIHLWRAPLRLSATSLAELRQLLSDDERVRADRYRFDGPAQTFTVGRGVLRLILSRYLGADPRQLQFGYNRYGKPELADVGQSWLQFSLAHSGDWVVYALAFRRPVGVDLEVRQLISDLERLVGQFFSPAERASFASLSPEQREAGFFRAWTRKEAYIKARGLGFSLSPDRFTVTLAPELRPKLLEDEKGSADGGEWSIVDVDVAAGYAAAVATRGPTRSLSLYRWIT
jgi:4'-phosphopantetheinyl transferase